MRCRIIFRFYPSRKSQRCHSIPINVNKVKHSNAYCALRNISVYMKVFIWNIHTHTDYSERHRHTVLLVALPAIACLLCVSLMIDIQREKNKKQNVNKNIPSMITFGWPTLKQNSVCFFDSPTRIRTQFISVSDAAVKGRQRHKQNIYYTWKYKYHSNGGYDVVQI